jgi:acetyl esterase
MPLHPVIQTMLDKAANLPPLQSLPVATIRAGDLARYAPVPRPEVGQVEDRSCPGPRGPVAIRIYRPAGPDAGPLPVIVFFHGSGFVICSIDTHDGLCRQLCNRSGMIVVSVDYALAPEQKFPAAPDDCLAATQWVAANAPGFGGDPARLVLAGDSAGGNLAAVTALRLRDSGGPAVRAQLLMYPVTDHYSAGMESYTSRGTGYGLTAAAMEWFWNHYLNDPSEGASPDASPNRAADLSGLPAAYVITAEYDLLRDEGAVFARRLQAAGTPAVLVNYSDANHGFMSWVGVIDTADHALQAACDWLKATV